MSNKFNHTSNKDSGSTEEKQDTNKKSQYLRGRRLQETEIQYDASGKEINPYIPRFISNAPWYAEETNSGDYLGHQRSHHIDRETTKQINDPIRKIIDNNDTYINNKQKSKRTSIIKFKPGSCTNCGSKHHKAKDCLERKRKIGAKYSNIIINDDSINIDKDDLTWDEKRDRWSGYNPKEYKKTIKEYKEIEDLQKLIELQKVKDKKEKGNESDEEEDEFALEEAELGLSSTNNTHGIVGNNDGKAVGQGYDKSSRMSTRSLRNIEDTAIYLKAMKKGDEDSEYNPKSRTLRSKETGYINDNNLFVRKLNGEAEEFEKMNKLAWEQSEMGIPIHLQANPTESILKLRKLNENNDEQKILKKQKIYEKYGKQDEYNKPIDIESEDKFTEYLKDGEIKEDDSNLNEELNKDKDGNIIIPSSKYKEDIFPGNHTSIWGSYWKDGRWGYKCCHAILYNAYCAGEVGIRALKKKEESI